MRRTAHAPSARNRPTLMVGLSGPLLPLFVVVFAASAFWPAGSAAQGVDSSRVDTTLWMANGLVTACTRSGNTLYIGGDFTFVYPQTGSGAAVDIGTGLPSSPFPRTNGVVRAAAPDGGGGWYVGGDFTMVGSIPRNYLAHVLANGAVSDWNPNPNSSVYAIKVDGQTVYLGGYFTFARNSP